MRPEARVVVDDQNTLSHRAELSPAWRLRAVRLAVPRFGSDPNANTQANRLLRRAPHRETERVFPNHIEELDITAAQVRGHLLNLQAERALAVDIGLADVATYMAELDGEIELCRQLYVLSAVTEIASLRAEMSGPLIDD